VTEWHADQYVGTVVADRYHVDKVLGSGGMGFVVAATHVLTGRRVALKIVPDSDVSSVDRLMVEARAPGLIHHPNIVPVLDIAYDVGLKAHLLVQELLEGHDLREELDRHRRLPWRDAVMLLLPVIDAVAAAHEAGVVHRDLKPENIFLQTSKPVIVPWVLDFGIARITDHVPAVGRLTTVGAAFGTPTYMSPEQARGERDVDAKSDIWALGIILFEMLVGFTPFDGENYNATLTAIQTKDPMAFGPLVGIPKDISAVVARALEKDRDDRFSDARAMYRALDKTLPAISTTYSGTAATAPPPPMVTGSRRFIAALSVMAICAVTIVGAVAPGMIRNIRPQNMPVMRAALVKNVRVVPRTMQAPTVPQVQASMPVVTVSPVQVVQPTPTASPAPRPRRVAVVTATPMNPRTIVHGTADGSVRPVPRNGAPVFEP
jgi:eukaryotic-like serine/threonine-protein kinase